MPIASVVSANLKKTKMKTAKSIILLTILGFFSCKNENNYKTFQPATIEYINSIKYDCISVDTLKETKNPFKSIWEHTYYDSIYNSLEKECRDSRKNYDCFDSINRLRFTENINGVLKFRILKRDSINATNAIIYEDSKYEDPFNVGYWVALSKDNGATWKNYYTGVTKANFYYFKPQSTIPLFVNDSILQIESAIVRKVKQEILPIGAPEYELLKDGLIASINLNKLCLDSDKDGLTDIEEKKLLTNPFKADSDSDGIIDGQDGNPKFKNIDSDFSTLIRFLLERNISIGDSHYIPFSDLKKSYNTAIEKHVYMVVTDDQKIVNLSRTQNTYIFVTKSELENYMKSTPVTLNETGIEIKRVGIFTEQYKISIIHVTSSIEYLVIKTKTGWKITIESTLQI